MYLTKAVFLYYLCGCYIFIWQWGGTGSVYLGYVFMSMKILLLIGYKAGLYDIMMFKRRAVLDFSALPAFFVTNLLLVQCENHYFRRLIVSFNC